MSAEKELTRGIHNKDLKKKAVNFAVPGETLCDSAVGWELGILCPTKKKKKGK